MSVKASRYELSGPRSGRRADLVSFSASSCAVGKVRVGSMRRACPSLKPNRPRTGARRASRRPAGRRRPAVRITARPAARSIPSARASSICSRPASELPMPAMSFKRLGRLHAADDADQRREHAHRRAGDVLERRVGREDAGVAGRGRAGGCRRPRSGRRSRSPRRRPAACAWRDAGGIDAPGGWRSCRCSRRTDVGVRPPAHRAARASTRSYERGHLASAG